MADRLVTRDALVRSFCPAAFADGHVSIVMAYGREYREDGLWHWGSVSARSEVIGAMTAAGSELGEGITEANSDAARIGRLESALLFG